MPRKPFFAAGAVLVLVVVALALLQSSKGGREGPGAVFDARRPAAGGVRLPEATLLGGDSPGGRLTPAVDVSDFEAFLDLLAKTGEEQPLAKEFAKAFAEQPALRRAFQEFKEDQAGPKLKGDLETFARELGSKLEFRRLLAKFSQDPGFKQVVAPFMRFASFRGAIREQLAAMRVAKAAAARSALSASASRRGGAQLRTVRGASGGGGRVFAASAPGAAQGTSAAAVPAGGEPAGGAGPAAAGNAPEPASGDGAHRVQPSLADLELIEADKDAASVIASLCYRKDPSITQDQCEKINQHLGDYGLWEACAKADLYEKCGDLCKTKKELKCGNVPNFYEVCLNANEPNCLSRCQQMSGCTPPPPPPPPPVFSGPTGGGPPPTGTPGPSCSPRTFTENGGYCAGDRWIMQQRTCSIVCPGGAKSCGSWRTIGCLASGTPVATPEGERPIESLRQGDRVYAVDPHSGALVESVVSGNLRTPGRPLMSAVLADGRIIRATEEHPFWDADASEYRPLGRWVPGQRMLARPGAGAPLEPVALSRLESAAGEHEVFDLSVEHAHHNFIAGGVLVHNKFLCY